VVISVTDILEWDFNMKLTGMPIETFTDDRTLEFLCDEGITLSVSSFSLPELDIDHLKRVAGYSNNKICLWHETRNDLVTCVDDEYELLYRQLSLCAGLGIEVESLFLNYEGPMNQTYNRDLRLTRYQKLSRNRAQCRARNRLATLHNQVIWWAAGPHYDFYGYPGNRKIRLIKDYLWTGYEEGLIPSLMVYNPLRLDACEMALQAALELGIEVIPCFTLYGGYKGSYTDSDHWHQNEHWQANGTETPPTFNYHTNWTVAMAKMFNRYPRITEGVMYSIPAIKKRVQLNWLRHYSAWKATINKR
ncbi:MAG: hypothetical protein KAS32_14900, partial [Candidatus Peribacteraceae bacterium]|nr:hypothetical protein [Candidatus Peribacteraceae bacterium]